MINTLAIFGFTLSIILALSAAYAEETVTMFVGSQMVQCEGVAKQDCMLVKTPQDSDWMFFYDKIQGFDFEPGFEYEITVLIEDVENPPADASSKKYTLLEIVDKKSSSERHIPYNGVCAPGFVSLDKICVLNDRCGPGAYAGKVCIMDGKKQPYLRPSQQGNAGISASNVICAEGLKLIFKSHDGSPACVSPESVIKLKERGWQTTLPVFACTLEYAPVCGVDGKTYGNQCMLNAEHVAMKYKGECDDKIYTESELDKKYHEVQDKISKVANDVYNGLYNGDLPLDQALDILEDGKNQLVILHEKYNLLGDDSKTDMQIAMRFSTLGKMGFASIDSQINMIKNQITSPLPKKTPEEIKNEIEKSFSVKFNAIRNVIKNNEQSFEDGKYIGTMFPSSMRDSIYQSQFKVFELYDDLEEKKDSVSEALYQEISREIPILDKSVQEMWMVINDHLETSGVSSNALRYTWQDPQIGPEKGYFVAEIADNVYWLVSSGYQTMFVVTDEGVVAVDAPQPIGEKYLDAISEVTSKPITHMIYSHHHQDHTGAAGQIFSPDITYISHIETADVLAEASDPNRPVPNVTAKGKLETMTIGGQTIEMHHLGNFHSNGDLLILLPEQNVAMLVDLLRPGASPYKAFGVTPDIDLYLQTHDTLQSFDFDVLISGHTNILTTKDHIKTNKQFTLDVMENAKKALDDEDPDSVKSCVQTTTQQWEGRLVGLDTFMADHCQAMVDYHNRNS